MVITCLCSGKHMPYPWSFKTQFWWTLKMPLFSGRWRSSPWLHLQVPFVARAKNKNAWILISWWNEVHPFYICGFKYGVIWSGIALLFINAVLDTYFDFIIIQLPGKQFLLGFLSPTTLDPSNFFFSDKMKTNMVFSYIHFSTLHFKN